MTIGIALVAGIIIGWLIEWIIDWQYWRRGVAGFYETEAKLLSELVKADTDLQVVNEALLQSQSELNAARAQLQAAKVREAELTRRLEAMSAQDEDTPVERLTVVAISAPDDQKTDDFQSIEGIEPEYEQRMYEAGVRTYIQLASTPAEQLEEIIQPAAWQRIDYTRWQHRARELAEMATSSENSERR